MKENQLIVQNVSWQPNDQTNYILEHINTEFVEGGFYGILGPNGSGKTSLIRHILRFLELQEGRISIGDQSIDQFSRKELATHLSFVPQNVNMDINFSVYDIVAMGRTPYLKRFQELSKKDHEKIQRAMEITNCLSLKEKPFSYLSGGEAQRVLVARAIAQDTKWLILDEPISHLDIRYQVELMETLKKLNESEQKTIIAILHDLNLSSAYCKEFVLMKEGKIFAKGKDKEVLTPMNLKQVYEMDFQVMNIGDPQRMFFVPVLENK